jgi:hypothetical protein
MPRKTTILLGVVIILITGMFATQWDPKDLQNCVNLKAQFESNTSNKSIVKRLNTECSGWESDY